MFGATAVFYCIEAQKSPEHIFREKGGKRNIFFPGPRGGLAPISHLLALLGGTGREVSKGDSRRGPSG